MSGELLAIAAAAARSAAHLLREARPEAIRDKGNPKDLVTEINKYGGKMGEDTAGVPEADIEIARRTGCTKVNIDTDLRLAMTAAIRKVLFDNPKEFDPRKYLGPARTKVKELVRHKVKNVLCCAGHAFD